MTAPDDIKIDPRDHIAMRGFAKNDGAQFGVNLARALIDVFGDKMTKAMADKTAPVIVKAIADRKAHLREDGVAKQWVNLYVRTCLKAYRTTLNAYARSLSGAKHG